MAPSRCTSSGLLQGFQKVVAVVVGQADQPPLPGLSSSYTDAFRIDLTAPQITSASFVDGGPRCLFPTAPRPTSRRSPSLTTLTLYAVDHVDQAYTTLVTPSTVVFDALNPATAENISNYSLINTSENDEDESAVYPHGDLCGRRSDSQSRPALTSSLTTGTST